MKLSQLSLADYNQLDSIPVINQDLSASGFTPTANTYYRHTGATTDTFTQGVIYLYDTAYHKLGESGGGTTLNKYTWTLNLKQAISTEDARRLSRILSSKCTVIGSIYIDGGGINLWLTGGSSEALFGIAVRNDNNSYNITSVVVTASSGYVYVSGIRFKSSNSADSLYRSQDNPSSSPFETLKVTYYNDTEIT